ncbi:hypothetical protein [Bifidobacterium rousetti]|uniref:hypothetical protein n=1 Tax=Bifidobacterium rousetti TaxID=2045439 RepID=UPI00123B5405|nr:hypothetical protein [Bifidobacterium rousetti]
MLTVSVRIDDRFEKHEKGTTMKMHHYRKAVVAAVSAAIIVAASLIVWYLVPHYERSNEPAAYRIIYSAMLESNKGGVLTIDRKGGIIADERVPELQDASVYSYENGKFIAGGQRSNMHLIIDKDGAMRSFHLLDNPNYSGVMSIGPYGDGVVAVMNGNDSPEDDSYLNLLVVQDGAGKVTERKILKIYTEGQASDGQHLFITGHELTLSSNRYQGKIIRYGLSDRSVKEQVTDDALLYLRPVVWNNHVLVAGTDMNGTPRQIDMFDANTLERADSTTVSSDFQTLVIVAGKPWAVGTRQICPVIEQPFAIGNQCISMPTGSSPYVSQAIVVDTRIVMLVRESLSPAVKVTARGVKQVGIIADADTTTGKVSTTPALIPTNRSSDVILGAPVAP